VLSLGFKPVIDSAMIESDMINKASVQQYFFQDRAELFVKLAARCTHLLKQALSTRPQASFLVSGGGTPEPLFKALSATPLDWERVTIALVDERWVDENHQASNAALVKASLLQGKAAAARFVGMKNSSETAQAGACDVNAAYSDIPAPFDLLVLGMGPDGHIASLFPHSAGLEAALDLNNENLCCAIQAQCSDVTGENTERMSLTLNGMLQVRQIILLITGEEKLKIYQNGLSSTYFKQLPVSAVLQQQRVPVEVYWAP